MTPAGDPSRQALLRRGFALEYATLSWNVIGIVVLAIAAVSARSVALAAFGLQQALAEVMLALGEQELADSARPRLAAGRTGGPAPA